MFWIRFYFRKLSVQADIALEVPYDITHQKLGVIWKLDKLCCSNS